MQMILLFRNVFALPVLLVLVNPGVNFVHGKRLRKTRQTTSSNHETPNSAPSSKRKVDNAGSVNDIFDGDTIIPLRFLEFSMALMPTDMPSRTRALPDSASTNAPSSNIPTERPTSSLDSNEIVSPPTKPITESTRAPSAFPITASPTKSPSMAPTGNCNLTSERRKEMIRNILFKVSLETDMTDPRSPQSRALDWIVNKDSLRLCPKNQKELVQRYVAAVFYYSAGGGSWDECNAPMDFNDPNELDKANDNCNIRASSFPGDVFGTNAWLTPTNECEWGGLSCLPESSECSMCIDQISFGESRVLISSCLKSVVNFLTFYLTFMFMINQRIIL